MPAVKFFERLDLERKFEFFKGALAVVTVGTRQACEC